VAAKESEGITRPNLRVTGNLTPIPDELTGEHIILLNIASIGMSAAESADLQIGEAELGGPPLQCCCLEGL
jgi:hypothetical protein